MNALRPVAQDPVNDLPTPGTVHIPVAESDEELSDFRLENHNQRNHSHVQNRIQERCHELHVERRHENAYEIERNDCDKDAHSR